MTMMFRMMIAATAVSVAAPAAAQEVIVTAKRRGADNGYVGVVIPAQRPIIVLKRSADYVIQEVRVAGDTRETAARAEEINATLRNAIATAPKGGVELAVGDYVVEPLSSANYRNLSYGSDGRPDTSQTTILVKVRLAPGVDIAAARERVARFVTSVDKVGRSTMKLWGEPTLSMVNPDQYRSAIIDLIAADAASQAAKFGPAYGVDVTGLDRPVEWSRAGLTEVYLYLPSSYTVTRK
ncbi:TonB-dependent receptor [Sphingomonas sp. HF-S3]|uniref:TonB-dependent receptor n=1 Tax=Sphingomonas rustica TaxID=3103142 RepID=A0ABV0B991_9SPHN